MIAFVFVSIYTVIYRTLSELLILWYIDMLLGNNSETTQKPLLSSGPRATMEVVLEAAFSMWSAPRLYDSTDRVQFSEFRAAEHSGVKWIGWWAARGLLQFSRCEPLLLEAGSWGMGIVREPRVRGMSVVVSRYQTTTGEDTTSWKVLVRTVVNCRMRELAIAL
jgi:hypothetical protein